MNTVRGMTTFTAVTYNVVAQSFAHRDRYPLPCPEALDPTGRLVLLFAHIGELRADPLCLQTTHHAAYVQRRQRPDGTAVFARRSLFDRLGHDELEVQAQRPGDHDPAASPTSKTPQSRQGQR